MPRKKSLHRVWAVSSALGCGGAVGLGVTGLLFVSACSRTAVPPARPASSTAGTGPTTVRAWVRPRPLECPPAGVPMLQPNPSNTGHHQVLLTWNASASSTKTEENAVGYCLYRSQKKHVARKNPLCRDCEQVNPLPVTGTSCVDDRVRDDATYYYVVAAINERGSLSPASNEILTVIPPRKKTAGPFNRSSPLCRTAAASK
jgi:hypothetical protein